MRLPLRPALRSSCKNCIGKRLGPQVRRCHSGSLTHAVFHAVAHTVTHAVSHAVPHAISHAVSCAVFHAVSHYVTHYVTNSVHRGSTFLCCASAILSGVVTVSALTCSHSSLILLSLTVLSLPADCPVTLLPSRALVQEAPCVAVTLSRNCVAVTLSRNYVSLYVSRCLTLSRNCV